MNIPEAIYLRSLKLPTHQAREVLDFVEFLESRRPSTAEADWQAKVVRFAGCMGDDFPDDVNDADLGEDAVRETLE